MMEIKSTPNILGATRDEWRLFGEIWVAEENGSLVGVAVNRDTGSTWSEITLLYILIAYRGVGAGRRLFEAAWGELEKRGRNLYVISRNPAVIKMMKEKDMRFVNLLLLPYEIQRYNIRFMLNRYRMVELVRKSIVYRGRSLSFKHAIKTAS